MKTETDLTQKRGGAELKPGKFVHELLRAYP